MSVAFSPSTSTAPKTTTPAASKATATVAAATPTSAPSETTSTCVVTSATLAMRRVATPRRSEVPRYTTTVDPSPNSSNKTDPASSPTSTSSFGMQPILMKESGIEAFIEEYENCRANDWGDKEKCTHLVQYAARAEERLIVESLVEKHGHNWTALKDELKALKPSDFVITHLTAVGRLKVLRKDKLCIKTLLPDLLLLKTCLVRSGATTHELYVGALIECLPKELASTDVEAKLKATTTQLDAERIILSATAERDQKEKALVESTKIETKEDTKKETKEDVKTEIMESMKRNKTTHTTVSDRKPARTNKQEESRLFSKPFQPVSPSRQFYIPHFRGWIEGRRTSLYIELDSTVNLMSMSAFKSIPGLVLSLMDTPLEITGYFGGDHHLVQKATASQPPTPSNPHLKKPPMPIKTSAAKKKDPINATVSAKSTNTYSAPDHYSETEDDDKASSDEEEKEEEEEDETKEDDGDIADDREKHGKENDEHQNPQSPELQTLQVEGICKHALVKFGDLEQECHIFVVADHPSIATAGILLGMPFLQDSNSRVVVDRTGDYWLTLQQVGASVALRFVQD
ncbi:hypothetical protein DFQ26_004262 [Actinomortierella ambigua]|nr:hypothetical protein DFQ26_004262 [Actinomortierella ambigua]